MDVNAPRMTSSAVNRSSPRLTTDLPGSSRPVKGTYEEPPFGKPSLWRTSQCTSMQRSVRSFWTNCTAYTGLFAGDAVPAPGRQLRGWENEAQ